MNKEELYNALYSGVCLSSIIRENPDTLLKDCKNSVFALLKINNFLGNTDYLTNYEIIAEQTRIGSFIEDFFDYFISRNENTLLNLFHIGGLWYEALLSKKDVDSISDLRNAMELFPIYPDSFIYDRELLISVIWKNCNGTDFPVVMQQFTDDMWTVLSPLLNPDENDKRVNDINKKKTCFTEIKDIYIGLMIGTYSFCIDYYGRIFDLNLDSSDSLKDSVTDYKFMLEDSRNASVKYLNLLLEKFNSEYRLTDNGESNMSFLCNIYYYTYMTNSVLYDLNRIGETCYRYESLTEKQYEDSETIDWANEPLNGIPGYPFSLIPEADKNELITFIVKSVRNHSGKKQPIFDIVWEVACFIQERYFRCMSKDKTDDSRTDTAQTDTAAAPSEIDLSVTAPSEIDPSAPEPKAIDPSGPQPVYTSDTKNSRSSEKYVFISYSSKDSATATKLRDLLQDNDIRCWMAPGSIPVGEDYTEVIVNAIENSSGIVLVLSENAQKSKWVPKELDIAISADKVIFPIHIDDSVIANKLRFRLTDSQSIEVNGDITSILYDLLVSIKKHMS